MHNGLQRIVITLQRALLHIGLEKTGTTSLQVFLKENAALLRTHGLTYLCDQRKSYFQSIAHFPVAACLFPFCPDFVPPAKFRPAAEVLADLRRDILASETDVIISCEHFSSRLTEPAQLEAIRDVLTGLDVHVVCYLRRQDELALSAYSTAVRHGRTAAFDWRALGPEVRYFNYEEIIDLWASVFGASSIVFREFDRQALTESDIRRDFLALLGLPSEPFDFAEDENKALDTRQVEMMRQINRHLPGASEAGPSPGYYKAEGARSQLLPALPTGSSIRALLSERDRAALMRRFAQVNDSLASKYPSARFVRRWQETGPAETVAEEPTPVTTEDFARAAASYGLRIAELHRQLGSTRREVTALRQVLAERDGRLAELSELLGQLREGGESSERRQVPAVPGATVQRIIDWIRRGRERMRGD